MGLRYCQWIIWCLDISGFSERREKGNLKHMPLHLFFSFLRGTRICKTRNYQEVFSLLLSSGAPPVGELTKPASKTLLPYPKLCISYYGWCSLSDPVGKDRVSENMLLRCLLYSSAKFWWLKSAVMCILSTAWEHVIDSRDPKGGPWNPDHTECLGTSHPSSGPTLPQNQQELSTRGGDGGLGVLTLSPCITFSHYKVSTSSKLLGLKNVSLSLSLARMLAGLLFKPTVPHS